MADTTATMTTGTAPSPQAGTIPQYEPNPMGMFLVFPIILVIFYFFVAKPQVDKEKKRKESVNTLKRGDKVCTAGGIFGQVLDVKDNLIVVKIAKDVKVEVAKDSIIPIEPPKK